jgi:hypothetical protein
MTSLEVDKKKVVKFASLCLAGSISILLVLYLAIWFIESHPGGPANLWIASVPIIAMMLLTVFAMRSLRGMDELEQKIHTEAMAFAFLSSFLIITCCGFLALAGFMKMTLDWISPTMMSCWVVGLLITLFRYR